VGLKMNTQRGATKDVNLRKAIAYAFDYDTFLKIYNGHAVLEDSPFPKATKGYVPVPAFYRQDLNKAREYLAKSAYPNGGVELEYVYFHRPAEERKIRVLPIDNLAKLGLKVKMTATTWPNMVARASKVETSPDFLAVFTTPVSTDPDAVAYQYHKSSWGKYYGSSFYANDAVWALIDQARTTVKWADRTPLYADIQKKIAGDAPGIVGLLIDRRRGRREP